MAIILGANTLSGAFSVDNSCRFNDGDSPMMQLTPGSSATDSKKMTISFWCKLGALGTDRRVFSASNAGDDGRDTLFFTNEDKFVSVRGTLDISKAKKLLGYKPIYSIEDGYLNYINWYKQYWKNNFD